MPPKRKAAAGAKQAGGNCRKYAMAPVMPAGEILCDFNKRNWALGKSFASGGFGRIYMAKQLEDKSNKQNFVIKMEPADNGPLFQETSMYRLIGKSDIIQKFKSTHDLKFLGIPTFHGSGTYVKDSLNYRFLIMPRFGSDVEKIRESQRDGRFENVTDIFRLILTCLDVYWYLHSHNVVHADLKGENLLLEADIPATSSNLHKSYLADYGLARRVPENAQYKEMPKKAHEGTLIFTSLDAHKGCSPVYRGDTEILGYNIIFWLKGTLPWLDKSAENIAKEKSELSVNASKKLSTIFDANDSESKIIIDYLSKYFDISYNTAYKDKPDHSKLKSLTNDLISKLIAISKNQKTVKLNNDRDEDKFIIDVKRTKANPKVENFDGVEEKPKTKNVKPAKNNKVEISPCKHSSVEKKKRIDTTDVLSEDDETECDENDITLPDGWEEHTSRSTGETYYINIYTNKSQWTVPTEPAVPHNQDQNKTLKSDEIRVSHILCKHKDSKRPSSWREDKIYRTKDEALDRIKVFRNDIIKGKKSFARIAQKYSDCPSAKQAGDLGFFGRDRMQKPFEDASFSLKVDQLSEPVITDSGIHLILRTA